MLPSLPELRSRAAMSISCICIIYCVLAASLSMAPVMHRNAARARVKDAEGKVQRSHFGKKRFEVRTLRPYSTPCRSRGTAPTGMNDTM